jgi:hypothetical protein
MTKSKLFIPEKIKVGFNHRNDTYTGKLAYVIYFDKKGKLRKETSWLSWCHLPEDYPGARKSYYHDKDKKGIDPETINNVPTEGFVLNKTAGGGSSGWHHRNKCVRIYDPRGFEFEITVENLLFILQHVDCSRGKGLEGEFVYSWSGADLVLLPANTEDFKESSEFSTLQGEKFSLRSLKPGFSYKTKQNEDIIYIGRYDMYFHCDYWTDKKKQRGHVFWDGKNFTLIKSGDKIAKVTSEIEVSNFSDLVQQYEESTLSNKIVRLFTAPTPDSFSIDDRREWFIQRGNEFQSYVKHTGYRRAVNASPRHLYHLVDGVVQKRWGFQEDSMLEHNNMSLFAELENGKIFPFISGELSLNYCEVKV